MIPFFNSILRVWRSNSFSFIRFRWFLFDLGEPFSEFWDFKKLKSLDLISLVEQILQNGWIICSLLLYFNFKSFKDPNSSSFMRLQSILHLSGVLLSESRNIYKLKRWDLISGGSQLCRTADLFGPPSCVSILKVSSAQILRHSLHIDAFCMIQDSFPQTFEIARI